MPADGNTGQITVKTESGQNFKRLPSFKSPRDLKLSQFSNPLVDARTKKVFVPNLNVQRKRGNDGQDSSEKGREREGREDRGRGMGRGGGRGLGRKNFVQGSGVFSEGLAPQLKAHSWRSGSQSSSGQHLAKPTLKLNEPVKIDKEEEDLVMKELMREDFIDDPSFDTDHQHCPIELPLLKLEHLKHVKEEMTIKRKAPAQFLLPNGVQVKKEPGSERVEIRQEFGALPIEPVSAIQGLNQSPDSNFIFFQIPNSIPKLKVPQTVRAKPSNSNEKEEEEENERCTLESLPSGRIGTLQILKSGRTRLLLGDVPLNLEYGTQVAFKQELVSVDVNADDKTGKIVHVGNITTRMLVTPDWHSLLKTK